MPVPASKASELYKKLIEDGYTADNIGSEEEFSKKASTKEGAGKLHSVLLSEGYTEDNLGNIDEFTTKLVSVSPDKKKVSTTEQPASSEGLQDGGLESTTSTTETVPVQKKGKPAQIIVGELQTAASPEEQYKKEEGKILPPRGLIGFEDGYVIDKSITEEFEDFPEVAEKLEIKRESGEVEKPYSREALLKLRGTDYGAYKSKLNNVKTYFDIREDLGTGKANEFSRLIFETTGKGNVYDEVNNFIYSASKQKQIIDESLSGSKKDKAIDRLYENENNWVERSFTPELSKKYISEKLKKEYNIDDISSLSLEDVKQKMGDGIVNQGIFNKYKKQYFPETFEEGATADSKDAGNRTGFIFNGLLSGIGKYSAGAADLTMQLLTNILPDEAVGGTGTPEENREAALRQFREEAIPTIRTATEELYGAKISDSKREQFEKEFFTSAFRGVTESIPMMMGFKGSGLLLGGYDAGMQTINSTKSGQGLSEGTKTIFAASVGTASALLEKLGIDKIFGKQSKKVATNLAIKTMAELVEKSSVPITTEIFEKALMANVSSLKNKLIKSGGKIAEAGVVEFATGSAQEAANILGEEILNKVEKKQVFDPLDWGQTFSRIAYAGAQEAVGGGVFGAISIPFSKTRNYISEKVNNAKTPEDINKLKDEIIQFGQKQNISEDQLNAALSLVDQYSAVYSKIPADVKNRTKVAEQILERDELNEKAATTLQEAQDLDPAFQEQKVEEAKILTNKANEIQNKISGKPVYKIGDQTVDRDTFNNYLDSEAANKQDVELYVENDNEVSSKLEQMGGVTSIDNDTDVPFTTNKIEKYDTKNITGMPSEVRVGEELIQAEPVEVGGTQETGGGGVLQENVPSGEGKVAEVAQGEVKPIKINEFAKNLNESAGTLKTPDGKKASNYVSKEGVEVTLTEDEDGGYVNGNQVQGDIMLDFIGNDTKRGEGLASKELDKIIAEADKNNMSISLVVDSEQAIRGTESKKGLGNKELKKWYESKGFIFDRDSRFGYRPKATEDASIYKKPEYIAKKGEVKIDDIETHSSPQDLQEAFDQDRLKEGTFHEDGDNYIYKVEDGKLKEVKNVKYISEYEKGMYKPRLEYTELPVPSKKTQGEVKIKKSEKELGIEKEEPIFVEQKTQDEQTVRPESRGERTGREGTRTITPLEGAPSVPGINGADPQLVAVAEEYARQNGIPLKRQAEYAKVDENRAKRIADEYEKMKHDPQNPRVKEAYQNLIKQTIAQYKALVDAGYKFWFIDANIPSNAEYASSPYNALRDARQNKTMGVFPTTDGFGTNESIDVSDNPLMAETGFYWSVGGLDGQKKPVLANDLFRAVHDMFGHGLEGAGFRARGEENAWQAHVRLFTGSAIGAITSETRGQNSWLNYGKYGEQNRNAKVEDTIFADQKTGLMPEWTWTEGRVGDMEEAKTKEYENIQNKKSEQQPESVKPEPIAKADKKRLEQSARNANKREEAKTNLIKLRDEGILVTADKSIIAKAKKAMGMKTKKVPMTDAEINAQMSMLDAMSNVWKETTGQDNFYDTFIVDIKKGDLKSIKEKGGVLFQDESVPTRPISRVTLGVFDAPQFDKMKGQMVAPQSISDFIKGKGKQIEKDIINNVLAFDKYKGQKRISFDDFKNDVEIQVMKLEKIKSNSYATYGMDNLGGGYGEAKTIIFNAPVDHGETGHFSGDFTTMGMDGKSWELRQIPNTEVWAAVDKEMPDNTSQAEIQKYVGTAGNKNEVEHWINQRNANSSTGNVNKGLFGHIRAWFDKRNNVFHLAELQSDVYQKSKAADLFAESVPSAEVEEYMNREVWSKIGDEKSAAIIEERGYKVERIGDEWRVLDKNGRLLAAATIYDIPEIGYKEGQVEKHNVISNALRNEENQSFEILKIFSKDAQEIKSKIYKLELLLDTARSNREFDAINKDIDSLKKELYKHEVIQKYGQIRRHKIGEFDTSEEASNYVDESLKERIKIQAFSEQIQDYFHDKVGGLIGKKQEYIDKRAKEIKEAKGENMLEKQFIASQKVHEMRLFREAMKHAAEEGAEVVRFPSPYTLAVIEGYVDHTGEGNAPYEIIRGDRDRLEQGDIIDYGGTELIVVDSDSGSITVAPKDEVSVFGVSDYISDEVNNRTSEIEYEAASHFNDLNNITKEEIESYEPDEWMGNYAKSLLEQEIEKAEEGDTIKWKDIESQLENQIEDDYNSRGLDDLFGWGGNVYSDGYDTVYVTESRRNVENFNQPDGYESESTEDDFEDNLSKDQQTVVDKYKDMGKMIMKTRPDAIDIRDDNGMEWIEIKVNDADRNNPIIAFQNEGGKIKGAVDFMNDNKATFHIFDGADISTLSHEITGHLGRRFLEKLAENNAQFSKDYEAVKKWANVKDNQWTTRAEEKFARGFERYLREGKAPTKALEAVFANLKEWLVNIYKNIKGSSIDVELTQEVKDVFGRLLGGKVEQKIEEKAPVQENPFGNIPRTQVARDKYFDTTFGENADKAREIYNQGGTPAEMLAKMQEAGLEPPVPPTKEKVTLSAEPEKVGIRKEDIKELAIKYDLEIAERREAISDAEIERMAKELIANGYDVNKLVKESLEPEKRPLTDIEANILAEVAADMKAKIDKNSSDADIAKYRDVLSALNKGISENARGLRMAKVKKNVVESIADVMADMMIDMKQDELTTEQRKEAEKRFNDLKDALDKETELRKQAEQEIDRLNAELEIKKQKARAENKPKKNKQDYASERKAIIQSIKDKWNKASKGEGGLTMAVVPYQSQLMAIAPDVARLVKSYLEQGAATTLEEVRALLKKDIQDVGIDVKDEDVRELIAGNYNKKKPTRNQYAKKLYELKQEEKLLLQIEALERGEEPTTEKKRIEKNQKLKELRDKIKELTGKEAPKREKKEKTEKTEDEKFEQAVNARIKANQKRQSEIQDKINRGDFSPEVKKQSILENTELQENNKALYDNYLKSVLDKDEALLDYEKARVADKMKNRGKVEKLADGVDTLLTTSKGTVAMFDQSVFLVQMLPFALSHPLKLAQFAARAMKGFANKKSFDEKMAVLHSSGLWDLIEKSGLAIYEPKTAKTELRNELHGGDKNIWNKDMKVGGYNISPGQAFERATSSALNNARLYLFMNRVQDLNNAGKTFENSPEEFKAAARFANEFTGHGKVQEDIAKATNLLNKFIWSPKMFSSTLNILGLGDITRPVATANAIARRLGIKTKESSKYKGFYTSLTPEQGKFAAKELTRFILGGITIMYSAKLISMLSGDDEDKVKIDMNPKSSNFGNINVDGKNIAVFGRFASAVRTICQALLSEKVTSTGETKVLGEGYGNKTSGEVVFGSFVRGKMTPASGLAYDFFLNNRKNYYTKEELTAKEVAKQSFVPMSARDIIKDFDRDGALIGTLETIAKLYGTSIRDERDFIKKEKPTFTELEMKDEGDKKAFDFLKKYEIPVPTFLNKERYRLEVDAKHPEAGKTKDGKPYALYSDEEFKMYNDFKKDYIIKALKILNRLDKSGTVKLTKEVIEDKLKSVEIQASKVAKNKLIAKGKIARKNKEESDTDITIGEEFAELFSEENPEE